jgi:hypothetical protein
MPKLDKDPDRSEDSAETEQAQDEGTFCPACGASVARNDQFCRSCGSALGTGDPHADPPRLLRIPLAGAIAALLLVLAVTAGVLIVTGAFSSDSKPDAAVRAAQARRQRLAEVRANVKPAFDHIMRDRTTFFTAERRYLSAMRTVRRKVSRYRRAKSSHDAEVKRIDDANQPLFDTCAEPPDFRACPNPTYPDAPLVPDLADEIGQLRVAARQLDDLSASVLALDVPARLTTLHEQFKRAIDDLHDDATYNADTVTQALTPPGEGGGEGADDAGYLDNRKIKTLHDESALPLIKQMNKRTVDVVQTLRLPVSSYDIPGGDDADPDDHSQSHA